MGKDRHRREEGSERKGDKNESRTRRKTASAPRSSSGEHQHPQQMPGRPTAVRQGVASD